MTDRDSHHWSVRASAEGHVIGTFLVTTICAIIAVTVPDLPRPPSLDWGPQVPFGSSAVVFGLLVGTALALPLALVSLPIALLAHRFATRHFGHADGAHMLAAMVVTAVGTVALFLLDPLMEDIPWNYVMVNVPLGALGGLIHVRVLARHGARRASRATRDERGRLDERSVARLARAA